MRLIKWSLGLALVGGLVVFLLPFGVKLYGLHWLTTQGYVAELKSLRFNPVTGRVTLSGLSIKTPQKASLSVDYLEADIQYPALAERELTFRRLKTQGLRLDMGKELSRWPHYVKPVSDFVNRRMPAWRFGLVNALGEHSELCYAGVSRQGAEISQCVAIGNWDLLDLVIENSRQGWLARSSTRFSADQLYFRDYIKGESLMHINRIELRDFAVDKLEARATQLSVSAFHLIERERDANDQLGTPYQTQWDRLLMTDVAWVKSRDIQRLHIGSVDLVAWRQTVDRNAEANWVLIDRLRSLWPALESSAPGDSTGPKTWQVDLLKTRVVDSQLAWLDDSVIPPAAESLTGISFELGALSTHETERQTPFTLIGNLGERGRVEVKGQLSPFAARPQFLLDGQIKGLDFADLGGYSQRFLAEKITQGILDARFTLNAKAGQLTGDAAVRLTALETAGGFAQDGVESLRNSFNRLKTRQGSVDFDLYVESPLERSSLLGEVLGREIKRTLSALSRGQTIGPRKATNAAEPMVFEPLKFNPSATQLQGAQAMRLTDILTLAGQASGRVLSLCPVSTGGELSAIYRQGQALKSWEQVPSAQLEHLASLGRARIKSIQAQIAAVAGLSASYCEPRVDLRDSGPAYLEARLQ